MIGAPNSVSGTEVAKKEFCAIAQLPLRWRGGCAIWPHHAPQNGFFAKSARVGWCSRRVFGHARQPCAHRPCALARSRPVGGWRLACTAAEGGRCAEKGRKTRQNMRKSAKKTEEKTKFLDFGKYQKRRKASCDGI